MMLEFRIEHRENGQVFKYATCQCGNELVFYGGSDEECEECGQWYSSSGQRLRNPMYWGDMEGQGENATDFMMGQADAMGGVW